MFYLYLLTALLATIPPIIYFSLPKILDYLTPKPLPGIPHLEDQVPVLGDLPKLIKWMVKEDNVTGWFDSVVKELGCPPVCQVTFGLGRTATQVIVSDWQEVEDILTRRTDEFDRAQLTIDLFSPIVPKGSVALPTNTMWKHHRRSMGPTMTSSSLKKYAPRSSLCISKMIDLWKLKSEKMGEGCFAAMDDFGLAAMDAIVEITFGESFGCLDHAIAHVSKLPTPARLEPDGSVDFKHKYNDIYTATEYIFSCVPIRAAFPKISVFFTKLGPKYRKAYGLLDKFTTTRIAEGRAKARERGIEASALAECVLDVACIKETGPDRLPDDEMKDELFQFIVAGQDTSATTLAWGVKYLAAHPEVQEKLHYEIMSLELEGRLPLYADITAESTPYLEAIVWEMLRLCTTANGIARKAMCDTTILGNFIPKGTTIYVPTGIIGNKPPGIDATDTSYDPLRSPSSQLAGRKAGHWDPANISEFIPERWINDTGNFNMDSGPILPFSLGKRGCFGAKLAMMEMKLFVCQISQAFFLEKIPEALDSDKGSEIVTRKPVQSYVRPIPWSAYKRDPSRPTSPSDSIPMKFSPRPDSVEEAMALRFKRK